MGDYGFNGAGESGGNESNFNCEPDFDFKKCPFRNLGLNGDADNDFSCLRRGSMDADGRGWGYDLCDFVGSDYRSCSRQKTTFIPPKRLKEHLANFLANSLD